MSLPGHRSPHSPLCQRGRVCSSPLISIFLTVLSVDQLDIMTRILQTYQLLPVDAGGAPGLDPAHGGWLQCSPGTPGVSPASTQQPQAPDPAVPRHDGWLPGGQVRLWCSAGLITGHPGMEEGREQS